jgi:DNA-nicking Smr family endonuclease
MSRKRGNGKQEKPAPVRLPFPVEEEVDLHGLAVDEAMVQAELALGRWRGRPGAVLRFIHGHSSGNTGSIKGALKRSLETLWKSRVRSVKPEPGNPGATLVKLP